jgi:hypothetical protein
MERTLNPIFQIYMFLVIKALFSFLKVEKKLNPHTIKCLFLGYNNETKMYRLMINLTKE